MISEAACCCVALLLLSERLCLFSWEAPPHSEEEVGGVETPSYLPPHSYHTQSGWRPRMSRQQRRVAPQLPDGFEGGTVRAAPPARPPGSTPPPTRSAVLSMAAGRPRGASTAPLTVLKKVQRRLRCAHERAHGLVRSWLLAEQADEVRDVLARPRMPPQRAQGKRPRATHPPSRCRG